MTNKTINVPRELLENIVLCYNEGEFELGTLAAECHALLSTPSPAGVDGLKVVGYIQRGGIDGAEWEVGGAPESVPVTPIADAQAIIDGLRGEVADLRSMLATVSKAGLRVRTERDSFQRVGIRAMEERDQQAQRIGDLEGLLRSCLPALSDGGCAALANRIAATLSAGKEVE